MDDHPSPVIRVGGGNRRHVIEQARLSEVVISVDIGHKVPQSFHHRLAFERHIHVEPPPLALG